MQVLDWLEDELELGEYRREFARAKVDGTLLLNLEVIIAADPGRFQSLGMSLRLV